MHFPELLIDAIRALHLLCFAAGMGIAIFFDWRTMRSLHVPIDRDDIGVLHEIHSWITMAFGGLWITGLFLVYIRTGFEAVNFSPKLIMKLSVMTLMVINARAIARYVLPVFSENVGRSMLELPFKKLVGLSQCAINSICCWIAGLALGSSVVLKTADWDILLPFIGGGFVLCTVVGQGGILGMLVWRNLSKTAVSGKDA